MTIAIGLIADNRARASDKPTTEKRPAIFLASDSQTTYAGANKTLNAQKVIAINFLDGQVLVAQSGSSELGDKVIELLENSATDKILDCDTVIKTVQECVRDVLTAAAILDRFLHQAQVIAISGRSYRVKDLPAVSAQGKKSRNPDEPLTAGAAS